MAKKKKSFKADDQNITLDGKTWPRLWRNTISKKKFMVMPWLEIMHKDIVLEGHIKEEKKKNAFKIGCLAQIGFMIESEHGVWFGVNLSCEKGFKDLGPVAPLKDPPKSTEAPIVIE